MKKIMPVGRRGFTLMEVIIAVAIIAVGLVAIVALVNLSVSGIRINKSRIIASNLAQEGLEIVRNIRDNNWLSYKRGLSNWKDGLAAGDYRAQYDSEALLVFSSTPLKIDSNGFYQYGDSGTNTLFYRKITIQNIDDNQFKAVCEITWQENGRNNVLSAETRFYNWLKEE